MRHIPGTPTSGKSRTRRQVPRTIPCRCQRRPQTSVSRIESTERADAQAGSDCVSRLECGDDAWICTAIECRYHYSSATYPSTLLLSSVTPQGSVAFGSSDPILLEAIISLDSKPWLPRTTFPISLRRCWLGRATWGHREFQTNTARTRQKRS